MGEWTLLRCGKFNLYSFSRFFFFFLWLCNLCLVKTFWIELCINDQCGVLSGSFGKPCAVAEGVCEGAGGVVPEHPHGVAVRGGQTLPAERLEQACRGKCWPLRAPRSTLLLSTRWGRLLKSLVGVRCCIFLCRGCCAFIWVLDKGLCLAQLVCWLLPWAVAQSPSNVWNGASGFHLFLCVTTDS